jgi:hypothetical protein
MLEINAFTQYFSDHQRLNDCRLLELFLLGQAFLGGDWKSGSWYDVDREWMKDHNEPLPEHAKSFIKAVAGLPRLEKFLHPSASQDLGFSYLYSRYSEFVHPAFARPRGDFEGALGMDKPHRFGSKEYFEGEVKTGAPISLILGDIGAACMCMQLFWVKAIHIDPHFDDVLRPRIVQIIQEAESSS